MWAYKIDDRAFNKIIPTSKDSNEQNLTYRQQIIE
jgi:hypothetical protein